MSRVYRYLQYLFFLLGFVFLFIYSNVLIKGPNEVSPRDLLHFTVPQPPLWTSYIPVLGGFIGYVFEYFSIHGLVGIFIFLAILYVSGIFGVLKDNRLKKSKGQAKSIDTDRLHAAFIIDDKQHRFTVHLVNPTHTHYTRIELHRGGFASQDNELLEVKQKIERKGELLPNSHVLLDECETWGLDFVNYYDVRLQGTSSDKIVNISFDIPKYGWGYKQKAELLPILNKEGMRIDLVVK